MKISIIGVGLIGGSLALSLRRTGFASYIIGVDNNEEHCTEALSLNLIDEVLPLEEAVNQSDLVILSIPIDKAKVVLGKILDNVAEDTVVVDMGSTKNGICTLNRYHPKRRQYVASHPIAGTEYSGPKAAIDNLFDGKKTIICERELSSGFALQRTIDMYKSLNMDIIYMNPEIHDRHIAFVSHISHISSFALSLTVLNIEKDERTIFDMAGSGFSSTARLAKSSAETWAPIFMQNAESVSYALGNYIEMLQHFKNSIDNKDAGELKKLMLEANNIKRIIK